MLASIMILATEATEGSNVSLVLPETSELIAGIVAFTIVFVFVWKRILPALDRTLEARRAGIAGKLEEAEATKQEAEKVLSDYKQQLANAKEEANKVIEEARVEAGSMKTDIIAKANTEAEQILVKAREDAGAERDRVLADAKTEVANLSIDLAERVVGENLDRQTQLGMVERYIQDLER